MWNIRFLSRIDGRIFPIVLSLMLVSLFVISSMTGDEGEKESFFTPWVISQIEWFCIGWGVFFFFAGLDYRKFYNWAWIFYGLTLLLLAGLFLAKPIQSVHRWYRLPFIEMSIQPSEYAKLVLVVTLGAFLDRKGTAVSSRKTAFQIGLIVIIPFFLILKQPDLGTALVLYPITLVMCYFGGVHKKMIKSLVIGGFLMLFFVFLMFTGTLSHEKLKPFFTSVLKEYQYERLNPDTYHQKAAQIAIAVGGWTGTGWHKSEFAGKKWLPASHTDSVFAAYGEEFGFVGILILLALFYALIYCSFQIVDEVKDSFGKLLASGIAIYLAMHMMVNMAMMCGFLPITGVPLVLVSYGGSSIVATMAALGVLQSIYTRRFMF